LKKSKRSRHQFNTRLEELGMNTKTAAFVFGFVAATLASGAVFAQSPAEPEAKANAKPEATEKHKSHAKHEKAHHEKKEGSEAGEAKEAK
jgi:hypothetical protein